MVLKISVGAAVVVALVMSFLFVRTSDDTSVRGTSVIITLWNPGELSRQEVRDAVAETAREQNLTLYRSIRTTVGDRPTRTLSVINVGSSGGLPLPNASYSGFARTIDTRFQPASSIPADDSQMGMYITSASEAAADQFAVALNERGMDVTTKVFGPLQLLLFTVEQSPLIPLIAASMLGLLLGCVQSTVAHRRRDAIRSVQGAKRSSIIAGHVGAGAATVSLVGAVGLFVSVPALALYNGLAQFDRFALAASVGIGFLVIATGAMILTVALFETRVRTAAALAGKRPLRRLGVLAYGVHSIAFVVVIFVVAFVTTYGGAVSENRQDAGRWSAAAKFTALTWRVSNSEFEANEKKIVSVGAEAIAAGTALVAVGSGHVTRGYGPNEGNSILVNDLFVDEQPLLGKSGERLDGSLFRANALTLLVPQHLVPQKAEIVAEYKAWLEDQAEDPASARAGGVPIDVVALRDGQRVFNYDTDKSTSAQTDPVVAVLPAATRVLSDLWLGSEMTNGTILFSDSETLRRWLEQTGLASLVILNPVSDLAAVRLDEQERNARTDQFAGLLALVVVLLSGVIFATAVAERNQRSDFVRHVHGARRVRSIGLPVAAVALVGCGTFALTAAAHLFPSASNLALAGAVVVGDVAVVAAVLALQRRRLRAETLKKS